MERVCEFLQKAHVFYVATVEGNQPRVRPFGIAHIIDGKLCVMTGKKKPVSKQITANPKVEICACVETKWVRIAGELVEDDSVETRQKMLDAYPFMKKTMPPMMAICSCSISKMQPQPLIPSAVSMRS